MTRPGTTFRSEPSGSSNPGARSEDRRLLARCRYKPTLGDPQVDSLSATTSSQAAGISPG
jgi:hypothetical protein